MPKTATNSYPNEITIIGGGLAGCEATWQAISRGCRVKLHEMKPHRFSPAHISPNLGELVCSNSFRAADPHSAVGLLKEEMRLLGSLLMAVAEETKVPAGRALAVDREQFAARITSHLKTHPLVSIVHEEITELPPHDFGIPIIIATGPLTTDELAQSLKTITGDQLSFYDAIAPIIAADSLDHSIVYEASRYEEGPGDYINCPLNREEYYQFINAIKNATKVDLKSFEEPRYFEGCLPIEIMVERGEDTPRFGPMKPVGLPHPKTGREPYAVVQLRKENLEGSSYNMVGFQTKLTYPEQKRIFSMIPGLKNAEFLRLGSIHRNTFVCGPRVLEPTLQLKSRPDILLAGQITGVEGYVESIAMGLLAGINASLLAQGKIPVTPPQITALGALIRHLTESDPKHFQPSNINFGLFPILTQKIPKKLRGKHRAEQALLSLQQWIHTIHSPQET